MPLGKLPPPRRCLRGASFSVWFARGDLEKLQETWRKYLRTSLRTYIWKYHNISYLYEKMIEIYRNGEVQEISSHQIVRWIQLLPGIPRQPGTAMSLFNTGLAHWARKPSSPVEQGRIPASFSMWIGLEWFGKLEILIWYGFFHGLELFTRVLFSEWKRIWSGIWLLRILVACDFILGSWWYHSPGLQHANSSIFLSRWNSRFGDPQTCSCPWHNMANYSYDINDIWYMSRIVSAFLFKLANTNLKKT